MSPTRTPPQRHRRVLLVSRAGSLPPQLLRLLERNGYKTRVLSPAEMRRRLAKAAREVLAPSPAPLPPASPEQLEIGLRPERQVVARALRTAVQCDGAARFASLLLYEPAQHRVRRFEARGPASRSVPAQIDWERLPLLQEVFARQEAVILPDVRLLPEAGFAGQAGAGALMLFPVGPERRLGVLLVAPSRPGPPEPSLVEATLRAVELVDSLIESTLLRAELAASKTRYQSLLDTAPFLIVRLSENGTVLELNPQMIAELERQGLAPAEALGRNAFSDTLVPEEIQKLLRDSLERHAPLSVEKVILNLPRGQETMRIHSVPLHDPAQKSWGLIAIGELTTRYSMITAEAERTERLAAIGRVAASLAHEINNPLQSLRAHLELIRRYRLSPQEREQSLRILEGEVERLDEITRRILGFARPTPEILQPVSIPAVLEQTLALSRNYLQNQNIEIIISAPKAPPPCMAAPGQLIQVFLNIILNAAHAMQGEGKLEIRVRTRAETVELSFTNNGPPIPAESLPHLFEPFFTTRAEGTGLGLSVSHAIIQRHHGTIRAANLPQGRGVVFTITLPMIHENPPGE